MFCLLLNKRFVFIPLEKKREWGFWLWMRRLRLDLHDTKESDGLNMGECVDNLEESSCEPIMLRNGEKKA